MKKTLLTIALMSGSLLGGAFAETWTGNISDQWGTAGNWTPATVPNGTAVTFNNTAASFDVDLGGGTRSVTNMTVSAGGYTLSNGILEFSGVLSSSPGAGNTFTLNAGINLLGDRQITAASGTTVLNGEITGSNRLTITAGGGGTVARVSGDNSSFSGGITVGPHVLLQIGSNTALGTGNLIFDTNANVGGLSSDSSTARTIGTTLEFISRNETANNFAVLGSTTNNGNLTFDDVILQRYTGTEAGGRIQLRTLSDVEFSGLISDAAGGGSATRIALLGNNASTLTISGANNTFTGGVILSHPNYAGETHAGRLRVTADGALGTGDVQVDGYGKLLLNGGVTLANHVTTNTNLRTGLISEAGDNVLSGTMRMIGGGNYQGIQVDSGSLYINELMGTTAQFGNKLGAGVLELNTTTNVIQFRVTNGVLRNLPTSVAALFTYEAGSNPILEGNGNMTRALSTAGVTWLGDPTLGQASSGGFAAYGGVYNIRLNNGTATQTWRTAGTSGFVGEGAALLLNSTTANNVVDFQNGIDLSAGTREVRVADNVSSTADKAVISGTMSNGGVNKTGDGVLELTAANTYAGGTTVTAGTLLVNSASGSGTGSGTVTVNAGATLGGSGTISGATTISGFHAPGNSPGVQTFASDLSYTDLATVQWQLNDNTTTQGSPTAVYDQINVGGDLDFAGTVAFTLDFTDAGSSVDWSSVFWDVDQVWTIYDVAGTTTGFASLNLDVSNWQDSLGQFFDTERAGASFSLSQSGNDILLNYTAIPEPSALAMVLGAAGLMMVRFMRRCRNS